MPKVRPDLNDEFRELMSLYDAPDYSMPFTNPDKTKYQLVLVQCEESTGFYALCNQLALTIAHFMENVTSSLVFTSKGKKLATYQGSSEQKEIHTLGARYAINDG